MKLYIKLEDYDASTVVIADDIVEAAGLIGRVHSISDKDQWGRYIVSFHDDHDWVSDREVWEYEIENHKVYS